MSASRYMVLLDTDSIKDYVFATNKLREIRGASAILNKLNLEITKKILCKFGGTKRLFLAGGSGKITFPDKSQAREFCRQLKAAYYKDTDGMASITTVIMPEPEHENSFKSWVYHGEKELRKYKDSKIRRLQPLTNQYFQACKSTGLLPAEEILYNEPISKASQMKCKEAQESRSHFGEFKEWIGSSKWADNWQKLIDAKSDEEWKKILPQDLSTIGDIFNGYIGFIYADGNRMGQRLANIEEEDEYGTFSKMIDEATHNAIFAALGKNLKMGDHVPFEIMLLGGDDLMVVVPANKAMKIAMDFCNKFKENTGEKVSICAGVVICHANYPIHNAIDHAESLLKSAKRLSNKDTDAEINAIDYMVIKGSSLQDLKKMREAELSYRSDDRSNDRSPDILLYQRPYTTEKMENLIGWITKFKKSDFPKNKLKSMYESLYRGRNQAMLDYLLLTSRLPPEPEKARDVMKCFKNKWDGGLDCFPWKKNDDEFVTPFIDLTELYEYIDQEESNE